VAISLIEFIAKIAWPVSILIIALVYRRLLTDLIAGGVTRLRAGPFELAWDQAKSGVERPRQSSQANARRSLVPADLGAPQTSLLDTDIRDLADSDPREAVLRAYDAVREAFRQGLAEAGSVALYRRASCWKLVAVSESGYPLTSDEFPAGQIVGRSQDQLD
jgi:hypothetical protein